MIIFSFLARNGSQMVKNHLVNIQWTIRSHLWPILSIFQNFQFLEICGCSFNHQYFENFSILGQFWWIFWLSFNETWCFLPEKSIKHARAHKMKSEFKKLSKISIYLVKFFSISGQISSIFLFLINKTCYFDEFQGLRASFLGFSDRTNQVLIDERLKIHRN